MCVSCERGLANECHDEAGVHSQEEWELMAPSTTETIRRALTYDS